MCVRPSPASLLCPMSDNARRPNWPCLLLPILALPYPALAADKADNPQALSEVVVSAERLSDTEQRQFSTASKLVFGREELERYGDSSVADVLKRLPGITLGGRPGRGGEIRMRGLGSGYTQVLLNGDPMPRGFSLDTLAPEQIERIEVMRAPVAEHSAQAIAGTINIVLRESISKRSAELRPSLGWENGRFQPGMSAMFSDQLERLGYTLAAHTFHRQQASEQLTETVENSISSGQPGMRQTREQSGENRINGIHLNGRFNWALGPGSSFSLQPFIMQMESNGDTHTRLQQSGGSQPAPYDTASNHSSSDSQHLRLIGNWKQKLADNARLELRANLSHSAQDSQNEHSEYDSNGLRRHQGSNGSEIRDNALSTAGKYLTPIGKGHAFAFGWEVESHYRDENSRNFQDGLNVLASSGSHLSADTRKLAAYAQDEWDISPLWAVYGGLRWESLHTHSDSASGGFTNDYQVLSPLFHSVWRFDPESKDQLRLALTRSYRAPTLNNLSALPSIASAYPVSSTNTAAAPDQIGNPNLKPELAWGLDLALEHYLPQGGLLSASSFYRQINNLIRNLTTLESVSWASEQRWVSRPVNIGEASSYGIELESKFKLAELLPSPLGLDVRANYSYYWSSVSDIPGPNNRLEQQPRQSANLGLDYRLKSAPLTLGSNLHWIPAYRVQQSGNQALYQGNKRVADMYALWKLERNAQLRISAANWLHADYLSSNSLTQGDLLQQTSTLNKTYRSYSARLELKF